ncbi:MAG: VWA domain-containing protein [Hyphomicrobium sp.]|jgi:nitric oxide reductase NorD protein|nr:VWA domain-containing protein [Hyphomicrobium sp.]
MDRLEFEPWEPEESIGKLWHSLASRLDAPSSFEDSAATLHEASARLGVLFRGLGGGKDVEIRPATAQESHHRLSWRRSLGQPVERLTMPSFDGEVMRLPDRIAAFPHRDANEALYVWLAAAMAFAERPAWETDPLRRDIRALQAAEAMTREALAECPGLRRMHHGLLLLCRELRPERSLPPAEAAVESCVLHLLGDQSPHGELAVAICAAVRTQSSNLDAFSAPRGYRPFLPVPLWPDLRPLGTRDNTGIRDETDSAAASPPDGDEKTVRANRKESDQAARKDNLILYKFESILSWAEFLNLNRRVDDDDEDTAKKAADDLEELALARVPQKARNRLRLHLDLSPEETEFERLAGASIYPEWDHRTKSYLADYCRVLAGPASSDRASSDTLDCVATRRRIRSVRRQFEALRPKRVQLSRQIDGHDIDLEAAVEARVELAATGEHSDRVYRATRCQERDLAVSVLLDASRSTESYVAGRQVIDIAREALVALAWGLHACGDETSIDAFSSLRRDRVFLHSCKSFDEPMGQAVEHRISCLRPGHYTRLGAAIRHASAQLAKRPRQRRLLLVLTDGKPNDLDHYEGRHGVEDSHMAVREARRLGQSVFAVTIDVKSQTTFSRIFGPNGFVVVPNPEKLTAALPQLYRHLVGG